MSRFVLIGGVLLLAACAKVGDPERPAPLFGAKAKADYQAQQQAQPAATPEVGMKAGDPPAVAAPIAP